MISESAQDEGTGSVGSLDMYRGYSFGMEETPLPPPPSGNSQPPPEPALPTLLDDGAPFPRPGKIVGGMTAWLSIVGTGWLVAGVLMVVSFAEFGLTGWLWGLSFPLTAALSLILVPFGISKRRMQPIKVAAVLPLIGLLVFLLVYFTAGPGLAGSPGI